MYNHHFPALLQVILVDKTPVCSLHSLHLRIVRMYPHQRDINILLPKTDVYITLPYSSTGTDDMIRKKLFGSFQIIILQTDTASLFQSRIRLGSPSRKNADRVQCAFRGRLVESMDNTVSGTQQYNKHKNAPCHGKPCKERTQFVPFDGSVYFLPNIKHIFIYYLTIYNLQFAFRNVGKASIVRCKLYIVHSFIS